MASPTAPSILLLTQHRLKLGRHLQGITQLKDTKGYAEDGLQEDSGDAKNLTFEG